jgi:hypothetical protein
VATALWLITPEPGRALIQSAATVGALQITSDDMRDDPASPPRKFRDK